MDSEPITMEEKLLNAVATGVPSGLEPITREEMYLAYIGGQSVTPPEPITRKEQFLSMISPGGGSGVVIRNQDKLVTENGTYKADSGYTGLGSVTVAVPIPEEEEPILETLTVTENGEYEPRAGVDGFSRVSVNVAGSCGGEDLLLAKINGTLTEYSNTEIEALAYGSFACTKSLTSVNLPKVSTIPGMAFGDCTALVNFDFSNVVTIKEKAFYRTGFTSINLPKLTTATGDLIFSEARELKEAVFQALVNVPRFFFDYCSALEKVDFHVAESLDYNMNRGNTKLTALIIRTPTVCRALAANIFGNSCFTSGTAYVYVPSDLVDSYKAATNWSGVADQIRAIEDYPEITGG